MEIQHFELEFEVYKLQVYNPEGVKIYKAQGQIKKGKTYKRKSDKDIEITIGQPGDEFPCIMLYYSFDSNTFKINKLRRLNWGGYENDEPVLCINPPLPEKGSLDFLVYLSLAIIHKIIDTGAFEKEPHISIIDGALKNEYPLSWLKFWNNVNPYSKNTYAKYGFQLRDPGDLENFSFEYYMNTKVPEILKMKIKDVLKDSGKELTLSKNLKNSGNLKDSGKELTLFLKELEYLNSVLKSKKQKIIKYNPDETLEDFIKKVFDTKRRDDYEELIRVLNRKYKFDIRGLWFLNKPFYDAIPVEKKFKILEFNLKNLGEY